MTIGYWGVTASRFPLNNQSRTERPPKRATTFRAAEFESPRQAARSGGMSDSARNSAVWPVTTQDRRRGAGGKQEPFSHKSKKHSELGCAECHSLSRDKIEVKEFPAHNACVSCHNFAAEMMTPSGAFCGVCHEPAPISKSSAALLTFPQRKDASDFGYNFSHVGHLKPQPVETVCRQTSDAPATPIAAQTGREPRCADCHKKTEPASKFSQEMTVETGHAVCFKCHCETPSAPAVMPSMHDCAKCHQLDGPKSPRLFNVVGAFHHGDHELDTRPRKKADLRNLRPPDFLCAECHQSVAAATKLNEIRLPEVSRCNQCHNGKAGLPDALAREIVESLNRR
jgi:hypothetical protein